MNFLFEFVFADRSLARVGRPPNKDSRKVNSNYGHLRLGYLQLVNIFTSLLAPKFVSNAYLNASGPRNSIRKAKIPRIRDAKRRDELIHRDPPISTGFSSFAIPHRTHLVIIYPKSILSGDRGEFLFQLFTQLLVAP